VLEHHTAQAGPATESVAVVTINTGARVGTAEEKAARAGAAVSA